MRQRVRLDLGQKVISDKEKERFERKSQRWAKVNRNKDSRDNPFLEAISPSVANYGDPDETAEDLNNRLDNYEFGNFHGYFNYRNKAAIKQDNENSSLDKTVQDNQVANESQAASHEPAKKCFDSEVSDDRIGHFKEEWIKRKVVLDIGCNRGHMTYALTRRFDPKSMVGIDIDPKLIMMANRDLYMHLNEGLIEPRRETRSKLIQYDNDNHDDEPGPSKQKISNQPSGNEQIDQSTSSSISTEKPVDCDMSKTNVDLHSSFQNTDFPISNYIYNGPISCDNEDDTFPNNLIFVEHNYVPASDELASKQRPQFDTIICLSVTKWIHLNYRDEGLIRFFKRIYNHLNPNGLFILEAQPFDNYSRRKRTSDRLKANFYSIKLKPEQFDEFLLSESIGFKKIVYESKVDHQCKGFKRPFKVFLK